MGDFAGMIVGLGWVRAEFGEGGIGGRKHGQGPRARPRGQQIYTSRALHTRPTARAADLHTRAQCARSFARVLDRARVCSRVKRVPEHVPECVCHAVCSAHRQQSPRAAAY